MLLFKDRWPWVEVWICNFVFLSFSNCLDSKLFLGFFAGLVCLFAVTLVLFQFLTWWSVRCCFFIQKDCGLVLFCSKGFTRQNFFIVSLRTDWLFFCLILRFSDFLIWRCFKPSSRWTSIILSFIMTHFSFLPKLNSLRTMLRYFSFFKPVLLGWGK